MTHIILLTVWCQQSVCVLVGKVGEKSEGKECMKEIRERFPTASEEKMTAECKCTKRSTAEKPHSWREICGQLVWVKGTPVVIATSCERESEAALKEKEQK